MDRHEGARPRGELELVCCGVVFFTPLFFLFRGRGRARGGGGASGKGAPALDALRCAASPRRFLAANRTSRRRGKAAGRPAWRRARRRARCDRPRARWVPFFFAFDARRKKSGCGADAAPEEPRAPSGARGARCARARGAETDGSGRARALVTRGLRSARARCPPHTHHHRMRARWRGRSRPCSGADADAGPPSACPPVRLLSARPRKATRPSARRLRSHRASRPAAAATYARQALTLPLPPTPTHP